MHVRTTGFISGSYPVICAAKANTGRGWLNLLDSELDLIEENPIYKLLKKRLDNRFTVHEVEVSSPL